MVIVVIGLVILSVMTIAIMKKMTGMVETVVAWKTIIGGVMTANIAKIQMTQIMVCPMVTNLPYAIFSMSIVMEYVMRVATLLLFITMVGIATMIMKVKRLQLQTLPQQLNVKRIGLVIQSVITCAIMKKMIGMVETVVMSTLVTTHLKILKLLADIYGHDY